MKKKEIIRRCVHLGQECDDYDLGKIYISSNKYEQISNALYGSWDTIRKCIKEEYMDALPGQGEKNEEKAEAAAKALSSLMKDSGHRRKLGAGAKASRKPYAPEVVWDSWDKLIKECIKEQ